MGFSSNFLNQPDHDKKPVNNVAQVLEKISPIVDRFLFSKCSIAARAGAYLFALCSTVTFFFICTPYGNHLIGLLWFLNLAPIYDNIIHSLVALIPNFSADHIPGVREEWGGLYGVYKKLYRVLVFHGVLIGMSSLSMLLVSTPSVRGEIDRIFGDGYVEFRGYDEKDETVRLLGSTLVAGFRFLPFAILFMGSLSIPILGAQQMIDQRMERACFTYLIESKNRYSLLEVNQRLNQLLDLYKDAPPAPAEHEDPYNKWRELWYRFMARKTLL